MDQHITTPITEEVTKKLHSGDYVYITGTIDVYKRQPVAGTPLGSDGSNDVL